jgi:hypothetical protein
MPDPDDDIIALQEAYANAYNELVKPDKVFVATQYFRQRWVPLLGPVLSWVIIALRQHCYWNKSTGEKRDWCLITQEELAAEVGVSVSTLKRLLQQEHAGKFILDVTQRYRYDPNLRKQVRKKSMYRIRMDDPLVPEDEARLKEILAQKFSGLDVDPETGQINLLQILDRPSETGGEDLQLNLISRSDSQTPNADLPKEDTPYPGAVFVPDAELRRFKLAEDQVLLPWADNGYLAVPIVEVVKQDLRISGGYPGSHTECFYSVQHALGESPQAPPRGLDRLDPTACREDRLPEEQERIDRMSRLEQALSECYARLGAFSLEEALHQFFSPNLVTQFLNDKPESEHARIADWVTYVRQQKNLINIAGFLRTKIEGGETSPFPGRGARERGSTGARETSPMHPSTPAPQHPSTPSTYGRFANRPSGQALRTDPEIPGSDMTSRELWDAALAELQLQMPRGTFNNLLKGTYVARIGEDHLTIACSNSYAKDWLENRLNPKICQTLSGILGRPVTVEYEIAAAKV